MSQIILFGSVGQGGANRFSDVTAVQRRLNQLLAAPRTPLNVDGIAGPKTLRLIRDFQKCVVRMPRPDGCIEPNGHTARALNDPASSQAWKQMPIPQDQVMAATPEAPGASNPRNEREAVQAAIDHIRSSTYLPPGLDPIVRKLLSDVWGAHHGGTTGIAPSGLSEKALKQWLKQSKTVIEVASAAFSIASMNTAFWTSDSIAGFISPVLERCAFEEPLARMENRGNCVYAAIAMAYLFTSWSGKGWKPVSCSTFLRHNDKKAKEERLDPAELDRHWQAAQEFAADAIESYCEEAASRCGYSAADARTAMRTVLSTIDEARMARSVLLILSRRFKQRGDTALAEQLEAYSREVVFPH